MPLKQKYLVAYNGLLALLWIAILGITFSETRSGGFYDTHQYADFPHKFLTVTQAVNAVFEITHALSGVVPSPLGSLFLQFFARLVITVGISWYVPLSAGNFHLPAYVGLSVAWATTEIVRYLFYLAKQLGGVPHWLLWLRYLAFIVLYPMGLISEPVVVYKTLPYVSGFYYWFLALGLLLYLPGFVLLYSYMWRQRGKYLRK